MTHVHVHVHVYKCPVLEVHAVLHDCTCDLGVADIAVV